MKLPSCVIINWILCLVCVHCTLHCTMPELYTYNGCCTERLCKSCESLQVDIYRNDSTRTRNPYIHGHLYRIDNLKKMMQQRRSQHFEIYILFLTEKNWIIEWRNKEPLTLNIIVHITLITPNIINNINYTWKKWGISSLYIYICSFIMFIYSVGRRQNIQLYPYKQSTTPSGT